MSKLKKVVEQVKDKAKDVAKEVDVAVVEENLGIVIDTVERINKTNTTDKADNIQRGVQDARKVLLVVRVVSAAISILKRFKRKY